MTLGAQVTYTAQMTMSVVHTVTHRIVEHPSQEGDTCIVPEPLDKWLKLSMAGTFSRSIPTMDAPLLEESSDSPTTAIVASCIAISIATGSCVQNRVLRKTR